MFKMIVDGWRCIENSRSYLLGSMPTLIPTLTLLKKKK